MTNLTPKLPVSCPHRFRLSSNDCSYICVSIPKPKRLNDHDLEKAAMVGRLIQQEFFNTYKHGVLFMGHSQRE